MLAGKALTVNMRGGQQFPVLGNYLLIDVAQVYMIWELALNAAMGMKRYSIIILADNCGCGVICHCGMSSGYCCILGTPCPAYFDS